MIYVLRPEAINSLDFYWLPFLRILNGFAAISLVLYPGYRFIKQKQMSYQILGHLVLMVLFILTYVFFSVVLYQLFILKPAWDLFFVGLGHAFVTYFIEFLHHVGSYYFLLLFIAVGKDYFEERTTTLVKKEQVERELVKTKLLILQRQIQPHFLFNTLNNVIAIIDERKESAQEMLVDLSELLRISMDIDFSKKITLDYELRIVKLYLAIEKKRFEHQLEIEFRIVENSLEKSVIPFLLQPLAENAIKHGYSVGMSKLKIVIETKLETDYLTLLVMNDGYKLESTEPGIGLKNVMDRIASNFGDKGSFELKTDGDWTVNEVKLPI